MPDHQLIYRQFAQAYDLLVTREDVHCNLLKAIQWILPLEGRRVVEPGAGTGRLTRLLAPHVRFIMGLDASAAMLQVAAACLPGRILVVADHRHLPVPGSCADLVLSGWSLCYLVNPGTNWQTEVSKALCEMERVLKPGGVMLIIETLGTGYAFPTPPEKLIPYYDFLEKSGFSFIWIRTDYQFSSPEEAVQLTRFFFGDELARSLEATSSTTLLECTGLWWKQAKSTNPAV